MDAVPILQIFAHHMQTGELAARGRLVKKQAIEQYICSISQVHASMGAKDPCYDEVDSINFCLLRPLAVYQKEDPQSYWVHPLPITILFHMQYIFVGAMHGSKPFVSWHGLLSSFYCTQVNIALGAQTLKPHHFSLEMCNFPRQAEIFSNNSNQQ